MTTLAAGAHDRIRRLVEAVLCVGAGGMLGSLVGLFALRGALVVPGLAAAAVMAAIPFSGLYAVVAIVPINVQLTDQITVTRLVVVGALGLTAFQVLTRRIPAPRPLAGADGLVATVFFAAVLASSVAFDLSGLLGRVGPFVIYAAIFFFVVTQADDVVRFRRVLWVLAAAAVLQTALVMAEAHYDFKPFGGWHAELDSLRSDDEVRVVGTHAHSITLAGFFLVAIAATTGLAVTARSRGARVLLLVAVAAFLVGWWYTYARSSWIGMAILVAAAMLAASRGSRALAVIGALAAGIVLALYNFSPDALIRDVESLAFLNAASQVAGVAAGTESLAWRLENWTAAWNMFLAHPLFGVGLDHSPNVAFDYLPLGASAHTQIGAAVPHNIFLQLAAEVGAVAVVSFVVLCALAFRALRRAAAVPELRVYAVTVFAALAGLLAMFFFNPMPREVWLVLALAFALERAARRRSAGAAPPPRWRGHRTRERVAGQPDQPV